MEKEKLSKTKLLLLTFPAELISIIQACHYANINPIFKVSPVKASIPAIEHGSDIPFDLYDIDEMPDNRQITIEE